jgi:hypothetical protein
MGFEPALDSYHAVFRLARLLPIIGSAGPLPIDTVRILDFYLVFPFRLDEMRFKQEHRRLRKVAKNYLQQKPYAKLPNDRQLIERMWPFEMAALETAGAKGFISVDSLAEHRVEAIPIVAKNELITSAEAASSEQFDLMELLGILATDYAPNGSDGLKARTGLLEYRYDPV